MVAMAFVEQMDMEGDRQKWHKVQALVGLELRLNKPTKATNACV